MPKGADVPGNGRVRAGGTYPVQPVPPVGREGGRLRNEGICKGATKARKEKRRGEPHTLGEHPWANLPLCSCIPTQLQIHPALSPSIFDSFPAWLLPVLKSLSPKSLSHGSPPASPFSSTQSPLSFSDPSSPGTATSSALVQLHPGPAFQGLLLPSPSSPPHLSISSTSGSGPHSHGGPVAEGCGLTHSPLSAR